jgi:hypothetical protein
VTRRCAGLACAVAAGLALAVAPVHAQSGAPGALSRLNYCVTGGIMSGVGPQGRELNRGPAVGFQVRGESAIGMQLGAEVSYAASNDVLNTTFTSFDIIARLSPTPEDYKAYVQLATGIYSTSFHPDQVLPDTPEGTVRPGGSFGLGLELFEGTNLTIGGIATYSGVIIARSKARSYLTAGVTFTFKPSPY